MFITLMSGLIAGPLVSFSGSPTMSPVTLALQCFSLPFPPNFVFGSSSIIFLALSQAPPALDMKTANSWPVRIIPARNPPSANGPSRKPTISGVPIARSPGPINSFCAVRVQISTTRP